MSVEYGPQAVGGRIARLRHAMGLRQSEMADALGVQRGELAAWESGGRKPSIAKAKLFLEKFPGLTLDWLFLGDARHLTLSLAQALAEADREREAQGLQGPR